ncbi:MAG: helix-turn-helix domain-containing protein, partial [Flavobacteriales bacterium]
MLQSNFLTVEQVADNLQVTRQTVSKYIRSNELNAVKINKSYRITIDDFESFLNKNSTAEEPQVAYLKRTKNCFLEYSDKSDEFEIVYGIENGKF